MVLISCVGIFTFVRAGGLYVPPARLRMMQEAIADKASNEFQRMCACVLCGVMYVDLCSIFIRRNVSDWVTMHTLGKCMHFRHVVDRSPQESQWFD